MKLSSFVLSCALGSRDPNYKYNKRVVEGLTGTDCNTNNLTIAKFSDDINCAEGDFIPEETMCTLQCVSEVLTKIIKLKLRLRILNERKYYMYY